MNREDVQGYASKTVFEALQRPACHENMVKVGGYILGEFGNLIAGDQRSNPLIQFELLHSKYHLCSVATRCLLLTTYVKFCNLFPEIKSHIQAVFASDHNLRNPDAELQQRAIEYLQLSKLASTDVLATILEEMPQFPEKESSLLSKLKKAKPQVEELENQVAEKKQRPTAMMKEFNDSTGSPSKIIDLDDTTTNGSHDIFNLFATKPENGTDNSTVGTIVNKQEVLKLVMKPNGILYEDEIIQIGTKLETKSNLARLGMFYGNKTAAAFANFNVTVSCPGQATNALVVQAKPVDSAIQGGAQVQQLVNFVCLQEFTEQPIVNVSFSYRYSFLNSKVILKYYFQYSSWWRIFVFQ